MSEQEEVVLSGKEIIKNTMELAFMDSEGKKALELLSGKLTLNDMKKFSPVLEMVPEVVEVLHLKYVEGDEKCIQKYKDAKKVYGSFNSTLKNSKRDVKSSLMPTIKATDTIFGKFQGLYDQVKTHNETEFAPYIEEQKRIKDEKEAEKNKTRDLEFAKMKEEAQNMEDVMASTKAWNFLRYDIVAKVFQNIVLTLNRYNSTSLNIEMEKLKALDLENFLKAYSASVEVFDAYPKVGEEKLKELVFDFEQEKKNTLEVMGNRVAELLDIEKVRANQLAAGHPEPSFNAIAPKEEEVPNVPEPDNQVFVPHGFIDRKIEDVRTIKMEIEHHMHELSEDDRFHGQNLVIMLTRTLDYINNTKN